MHENVLTCYHGVQNCVEGFWSTCGYGSIKSGKPRADLRKPSGRSPLAQSAPCADNPCNPDCNSFEEIPIDPIGSTVILSGPGSTYEWMTGSFSSLSSGAKIKGLNEPCSTGSDCQFNTYCYAPVSLGCSHSKCATGAALDPTCDACVAEVVAEKPLCGLPPQSTAVACEHSLCEQGAALADDCSSCASLICESMPSCCTGTWGASCVLAVASLCGKSCECGAGEQIHNGRCYYRESGDKNWAGARDSCQARGAGWDLAGIESTSENNFINGSVIDVNRTWLGFTSGNGIGSPGIWAWNSGNPAGDWEEPGGAGPISWSENWRYYDGSSAPNAAWNTTGFNDNSWSQGPAEMGFGNGDESTTLNTSRVSYYFRKTFTMTSIPSTAILNVLYDDGFVAYINGTEVRRVNVSSSASHTTRASGSSGDNAIDRVSISVAPFVVGTNVLSIVVKNASGGSNDLSFNAKLDVTEGPGGFTYGSSWKYYDSGTAPNASWMNVGFDDASWSTGNGQFGFGETDQATTVARNDTNPTVYFRKSFPLESAVSSATLRVLYDDGYVAYVNGTQVKSQNVSSTAHNASATGDGENTIQNTTIANNLFIIGTNVIAVMVKNRTNSTANKTDLSFDAGLDLILAETPSGGGIYQNFRPGYPDSKGACAHFDTNRNGGWLDASCNIALDSVCEGPPIVETGTEPAPSAGGPWTPISKGATWKYSDGSSAPNSSWKNPSFNDASWSSGNAQLGFGDGDEATLLNTSRVSYYFRKTFTLSSPITSAYINLTYDDGAQVYVNGTAVITRNVSNTGHSNTAPTASNDNETYYSAIDTSPFVVGTNVVAVMVKNASGGSNDLSFDLQLDLTLCPSSGCPPVPVWSQACVDAVDTTCDVSCDQNNPLTTRGICIPHFPGETDPNCPGIDLAVGVPCDGNIPVCNHGQSTAPAGLRLVHFPADFGGFATCNPNQSGDVEECFTDAEIPPGACIEVTSCGELSEGREIMINPPGSDNVTECNCRDNWSIYDADACGPPICSGGSSIATLRKKPVDVIFVIDNSGSMSGEIAQVQDRINEDFADIIAASGIDYRVIMMARYGQVGVSTSGSAHPICIKSPLGGHNCASPSTQPVAHNPPLFYHFSTDVKSTDGLCRLLQGLSEGDELASTKRTWTAIAPTGYDELLREEALKQIVVITDDDVDCKWGGYTFKDSGTAAGGTNVAVAFDTALTTLSPSQFGTAAKRNYVFHSIVAMAENSPGTAPWQPSEAIKTGTCSPGSEGPGTGYQGLSRLTGGLRYPTCRNDDFNAIFNAIAEEVVEGAELSCSFDLVNAGQFDPDKSTLTFTPGSGAPIVFTQVASAAACGSKSYYFEDADTISLCDGTCTAVQDDPTGQLSVEIECMPATETYETFEFTQTYQTECNSDKEVQWGFLSYDTVTPGNSSIDFKMRVADSAAGLATAPLITVATASAALGTETCALTGPSPCPIDLWNALGGRPLGNKPFMELVTEIKPTSDQSQSPTLNSWRIIYSCEFDH